MTALIFFRARRSAKRRLRQAGSQPFSRTPLTVVWRVCRRDTAAEHSGGRSRGGRWFYSCEWIPFAGCARTRGPADSMKQIEREFQSGPIDVNCLGQTKGMAAKREIGVSDRVADGREEMSPPRGRPNETPGHQLAGTVTNTTRAARRKEKARRRI